MAEQQNRVHDLFEKVAESPVYGDKDMADAIFPRERLMEAKDNLLPMMGAVAMGAAKTFGPAFSEAPKSLDLQEISWKAGIRVVAYAKILALGEARAPALDAFGQMVAGMYIPNDLVDSGSAWSSKAMEAIAFVSRKIRRRETVESDDSLVKAIASPIEHVKTVALPEDQPYLLDGVYQRILHSEVAMRRFSNAYVNSEDRSGFIARYARKIAETSSISAGARDIADGIHALAREKDFFDRNETDIPSLDDLEKNEHIGEFRQVLNTYARLVDDVGDCNKDKLGIDGGDDSGKFSINVFNQAEPELIEAYLDYGKITGERKEEIFAMITAFAQINDEDTERKAQSKVRIIESLTDHMREYTWVVLQNTSGFESYIRRCMRVATISHVNGVGDDNMIANT